MTEKQLHNSVADFFRLCLTGEVCAFHPVNEGRGGWKARAPYAGGLPGLPDWLVIFGGKLIAIELKVGKRGPSDAQWSAAARLTAAGVPCYVARSLEEVQDILRQNEIPTREALVSLTQR